MNLEPTPTLLELKNGLDLRDLLAWEAFAMLTRDKEVLWFFGRDAESYAQFAQASYAIADAMLAAREKGGAE